MTSSFAYLSLPAAFSNSACDRVLQFDGSDVPPEIEGARPGRANFPPQPAGIDAGELPVFVRLPARGEPRGGRGDDLLGPETQGPIGSDGQSRGVGRVWCDRAVCLAGAVWLARIKPTIATVFFYRQAAVIAEGDRLTLIPWQHLLWLPGRIFTSEGLEFRCGWMEEHDRFEEAVWERSAGTLRCRRRGESTAPAIR